ncbi:MAG TPA: VOC family protein [Pyrinomonadaceae bacterium]
MSIEITALDHVNITVPKSLEDEAKRFYGEILGLREIPKPVESRGRSGAWYQIGLVQLHLSVQPDAADKDGSRQHVCYVVKDLAAAEESFRRARVEIYPDKQPVEGWLRFYVRDPGGNRIEIAQHP